MAFEFRMPDIGEGVVEGEIVKWHVKPGQDVKEDDPLVEVMTDKATVMIPSPRKGKILETRGDEGSIIKVGAVMLTLDTGDGASAQPAPTAKQKEPAAKSAEKSPVAPPKQGSRALATPAVRKIAQDMGIDINAVPGSGPGGRVSQEDVMKYANSSKSAPAGTEREPLRVYTGKEETEEIPLRGLRKKIAEKMVQSKQHAPHYTFVDEIDMTELVKLRTATNEVIAKQGVKVSYLPFIIKAVIAGVKKYPLLNSTLDEEKGKIILKHFYNIGIGVATPDGLTVVVVKNADQKSISEIAQEIARLSEAARENRITLEDLKGSTITITSLGIAGGIFATPIINYPEVAILGIHKIEKRPVVRDSQIVIRDVMNLSLSFDHRVVDGAVGAEFCGYIKYFLESPALLFMQL
jgi:pyruvate dehydrogenase E2 component (dihydrolipoyllysine-residue acetyltransferase)